MMLLRISNECEVGQLTEISREAFHTDYLVGGEADDRPPDYDSTVWHEQMRQEGHLFACVVATFAAIQEGHWIRTGKADAND